MRVRLSSLRCFFFAIRFRRFLMTEPTMRDLSLAGDEWPTLDCLGRDDLRQPSTACYPRAAAVREFADALRTTDQQRGG
jgi:hypothetical protein